MVYPMVYPIVNKTILWYDLQCIFGNGNVRYNYGEEKASAASKDQI